jgi:hypothetical protein
MCRRLACRGLFVGPSSGAYAHATLEIAATNRYRTLATVLSDTGERYGSTGMWTAVPGKREWHKRCRHQRRYQALASSPNVMHLITDYNFC